MIFKLEFSESSAKTRDDLDANPGKKGLANQVKKSLGYLKKNPRHPSLNTHKMESMPSPLNPREPAFCAYAQNHTPSAHRIIFCYGPKKGEIFIIAIIPHL